MRNRLIFALTLALLAAAAASAEEIGTIQFKGTIRFDNWLYFQVNKDNTGRWQYRPRVFIPFNIPKGWTFVQWIDLPVYYTDRVGRDNPSGHWKAHIADWFIEELFISPEVVKNLRLFGSVRFVFPTGGEAPFGSSQYQWAPALGVIYAIPERQITLSPFAHYLMGFHATEPGVSLMRRLTLYPQVSFGLGEGWRLAFYPENPIQHNDRTSRWFVPIDAMLTKRLSQTVEFGVGGAYGLVKDEPAYKYVIDSRLTFYFWPRLIVVRTWLLRSTRKETQMALQTHVRTETEATAGAE